MEPLEANNFYHIFNRANGSEVLFKEKKNYYFFLEKYRQHITPIADTLAYCLMPNHFHFLVYLKEGAPENSFSKSFSNLFSAYTQSYNKIYNRKGSLFQKNFKRKLTDSKLYLIKLINYIHFNPVHHYFADQPDQWIFSSFNAILKQQNTAVNYQQVIELFDDFDNFRYMHQHSMDFSFDY